MRCYPVITTMRVIAKIMIIAMLRGIAMLTKRCTNLNEFSAKPLVHVSIEGTEINDKIRGGDGNDIISGEDGRRYSTRT